MNTMLQKTTSLCLGISILMLISLNAFGQAITKKEFSKVFIENCVSGVPPEVDAATAQAYCSCASEKYYAKAYNPKTKEIEELDNNVLMELIQPCQATFQDVLYKEAHKPNSSYRKISIKRCKDEFDTDEVSEELATKYCECAMTKIVDNLNAEELKIFDTSAENGEETPESILKLIEECFGILQ